jgi:predicted ArsR family transcriptional regulator
LGGFFVGKDELEVEESPMHTWQQARAWDDLTVLSYIQDENPTATIQQIADRLCVSKVAARRRVKRLELQGYLDREGNRWRVWQNPFIGRALRT